jgi:hypothetical protein
LDVRQYNCETLSERQFKSGVFDIDYAAFEEKPMSKNDGRKLSAVERERKMREEEREEKISRTSRMKAAMNQNAGDGVRKYSTRFGAFSGAGAVDPQDVEGGATSEATVRVTAEQKQELQQRGMKVDHLEEGDEIPLAGLDWNKPEEI